MGEVMGTHGRVGPGTEPVILVPGTAEIGRHGDGVRGMTDDMTIGQGVAYYRRRRGLSQEVLAGLVGRTTEWLRKVKTNRAELDRLSVIRMLARTLDVA